MSPSTSVPFLSFSFLFAVVLIFAAVSAKSSAEENCELGASCENEIEDDDGFSFDDLGDFGEDEDEEGFGFEGDDTNLPQCSELTYFEVELGTGADVTRVSC